MPFQSVFDSGKTCNEHFQSITLISNTHRYFVVFGIPDGTVVKFLSMQLTVVPSQIHTEGHPKTVLFKTVNTTQKNVWCIAC